MKKILFFLLMVFATQLFAQNTPTKGDSIQFLKCRCKSWSGTATISFYPLINTNKAITVKCNGEIGLANVGTYQVTAPNFICNPASCKATFKWSVTGPVTGNGTGKTFNFNFSTGGVYTVTFTPFCGKTPCEPCTFKIIIRPLDCKCGKWKDVAVVIQSNMDNSSVNVKCGGDIVLNNVGNYQITASDYICIPKDCPPTYNWSVTGPVAGNGTGKTFNFNFSAGGVYTVTFTPFCGKTPCEPCTFKIIIRPLDCKCGKWKDVAVVIQSNMDNSSVNVKCGGDIVLSNVGNYQITASDYICIPKDCPPTYNWSVTGPVAGNGTGKTFNFNFSAGGVYTVTFTPFCGKTPCEPCTFKIIIRPLDCKCGKWKDVAVVIQSNMDNSSVNVKCGGDIVLNNVGNYQITASDYICIPKDCLLTYNWSVTGPVTGNGTGKTFNFNFSAYGSYIVTILPICGNQKCEPCKFTIVIKKG